MKLCSIARTRSFYRRFIKVRMSHFLALTRLAALPPGPFWGTPSLDLETNASTRARNTSVLSATVTFDNRPRTLRSSSPAFSVVALLLVSSPMIDVAALLLRGSKLKSPCTAEFLPLRSAACRVCYGGGQSLTRLAFSPLAGHATGARNPHSYHHLHST